MPPSADTVACEPLRPAPARRAHRRRHRLACARADKGVRRTRRAVRFRRLQLAASTRRSPTGLASPASGARFPTPCSCARCPGGTFQAVTLRLGILHALRENGVLVWNDARAIERCVDKSMTSFLLRGPASRPRHLGDRNPQAAARDRPAREPAGPAGAEAAVRLAGAWSEADPDGGRAARSGRGRGRLLPAALSRRRGHDGFRDFRLLVSRGRVIAAMARHAGWITNVKQGGRPLAVVPDKDMKELAVRATEAVAAEFCRRRHPS